MIWDGIERRKSPRNGDNNDQVHTVLAQEIRSLATEMRQHRKDIACLSTNMQKYLPLLDNIVSARDTRGMVLRAIIKNTASTLVWAGLALIGYAIWQLVKNVIRGTS